MVSQIVSFVPSIWFDSHSIWFCTIQSLIQISSGMIWDRLRALVLVLHLRLFTAWVVLLEVPPCDWNQLDSSLFYHFGQFCLLSWVWKMSRNHVAYFFLAHNVKYNGLQMQKSILAITFDWRVLRTSGQRLWATFFMLFSGIPHLAMFNMPCQIAKYPDIWLIWLFGYLAARDKRGQVGYPWKEHEKCSSEALA